MNNSPSIDAICPKGARRGYRKETNRHVRAKKVSFGPLLSHSLPVSFADAVQWETGLISTFTHGYSGLPIVDAACSCCLFEAEVRIGAVVEALANQLCLSLQERSELLSSGKQTLFGNRVHGPRPIWHKRAS